MVIYMDGFEKLEKLIGKENYDKIRNTTVLIIGLGGVGGYVCESLARCNIKKLILVDYDTIDSTNINRQIIALKSTIGMKKVEVFKNRIKDISDTKVEIIDKKITLNNIQELFNEKIDYLVDACDTLEVKKEIIRQCLRRKIKFISSMGTANKIKVEKLKIIDIRKTSYDPIAKIIRKMLKEENIKEKITVLSSDEPPLKTGVLASNSFVPPAAGLMIGNYIIRDVIKWK